MPIIIRGLQGSNLQWRASSIKIFSLIHRYRDDVCLKARVLVRQDA